MKTEVLIIGAGITGAGLARDLALRGVACVLVEKGDFNAGASGGNHGLLHSGARYIATDPTAAAECQAESRLLKRLAPHCIENTGGLFVAVKGDDDNYVADFPNLCAGAGVPAERVDVAEANEMEPILARDLVAAYRVNDAAVDPFKLTLENIADACRLGAVFLPHTRVVAMQCRLKKIRSVRLTDTLNGSRMRIEAHMVINASGAWSGEVAQMAGVRMKMIYSKGSLLVTQQRMSQGVINRLRPPGDGDILVPGGTVSILGTTSERVASPSHFRPTVEEVDRIISEGKAMAPALEQTRYIRAYSGIRPLMELESNGSSDREVSRGFELIDHARHGIDNFVTITGGKLTTFRLMAEKTANFTCRRLGVARECLTDSVPLPETPDGRWTEPGRAPREWLRTGDANDILLCECEMIPLSAVDRMVDFVGRQNGQPSLYAIGLRSRMGKGPCQGAFCSARVTAHLYDRGIFEAGQGIADLKAFLKSRWRGQKPLMWEASMVQAELQEAMHCGFLGLELEAGG
jgi:glycerol-3-phosphate dehydrogenase